MDGVLVGVDDGSVVAVGLFVRVADGRLKMTSALVGLTDASIRGVAVAVSDADVVAVSTVSVA
jgi:hypothetical protein